MGGHVCRTIVGRMAGFTCHAVLVTLLICSCLRSICYSAGTAFLWHWELTSAIMVLSFVGPVARRPYPFTSFTSGGSPFSLCTFAPFRGRRCVIPDNVRSLNVLLSKTCIVK